MKALSTLSIGLRRTTTGRFFSVSGGKIESKKLALVRAPSPRLADGIVTHISRQPVNFELAFHQWTQYVEALRSMHWEIVEVPKEDSCPDSVFIEDTIVMFKGMAIITNPGSDLRKPETLAVKGTVKGLIEKLKKQKESLQFNFNLTNMSCITEPGCLDGGDVLKVHNTNTIFIGLGSRTNQEGIRQFAEFVKPLGGVVITVSISKVLHLKSAVTALPTGHIIGYEPLVDDKKIFQPFPFLSVPEESGSHVVIGDNNHILMAADAPQSASIYRAMSLQVTEVDISEFIKLEGCVTCLSVRIRI